MTSASGGSAEEAKEPFKGSVAEFQDHRNRELKTVSGQAFAKSDARAIIKEFVAHWLPRHVVEAEILAPALEDAGGEEGKRAAVGIRKDLLNLLLADLIEGGASRFAEAKLDALSEALEAVIKASTAERESLPQPSASALGPQMNNRFERMKRRFANSTKRRRRRWICWRRASSLSSHHASQAKRRMQCQCKDTPKDATAMNGDASVPEDERERSRGGYRGGPERDEEGRFMSENGRRSERDEEGRFMSESGRRSERDDQGRFMSERGRRSERDDQGRFMSESGRRSSNRYEDDEEGRAMSRSRGHEEDERYSRRDEGRGQSGWYGDREGHAEASRRGWRDPEHGESGWFGDREGHSQAARRGWEGGHEGVSRSRSRYEDDERRGNESRAGGRYEGDDEYDRGRGGNGNGRRGWSGDPEGHSEAARRGWEHRR